MPYITVGDERLFYTVQDQSKNRPSLLLLHGAGGTHLDWPGPLRRMPGVSVYALDLPGHGRSEGPGRTRIEEYAATVNNFINALQLRQKDLFLLGHSMGGAITQMVALEAPDRLCGIILIGSGARLRVAGELLSLLAQKAPEAAATIANLYWSPEAPHTFRRRSAYLLQSADPEVLHGDFVACDCFDLMDRLHEITLPALVISGSQDRLTPPKYGRYLADHLPDARLLIIEGGGHMMALEQPENVANAVSQFIDEVVQAQKD
jgi:pimeloyl-ACP methyl ester carboxylesterase